MGNSQCFSPAVQSGFLQPLRSLIGQRKNVIFVYKLHMSLGFVVGFFLNQGRMKLLILATLIGLSLAQFNPNTKSGRTAIVHLFEWRWADIAAECERYLGPNGFGGVQVFVNTSLKLILQRVRLQLIISCALYGKIYNSNNKI